MWIRSVVQGLILLTKPTFTKLLFQDLQVQSLLNAGAFGKLTIRLDNLFNLGALSLTM